MAQAKIVTEQEMKRALSILRDRRHADRDRLARLLTHWAGMRVCEVAALTRDKVLGPAGEAPFGMKTFMLWSSLFIGYGLPQVREAGLKLGKHLSCTSLWGLRATRQQ